MKRRRETPLSIGKAHTPNTYKQESEYMIKLLEAYFLSIMFRITEETYEEEPRKRRYVLLDEHKDNVVVGDINISATTHLSLGRSRSAWADNDAYSERHPEEPAIYISSLDVTPYYQKKGLGLALLFYGICKTYLSMYVQGVYAKYIKLNDATDAPTEVKQNIYHRLGLVHIGQVEFKNIQSRRLQIERIDADGEKEGRIETFFGAAYPAYLKKYHANLQNGGRRLIGKKTYRRKRYSRNKINMKSRIRR